MSLLKQIISPTVKRNYKDVLLYNSLYGYGETSSSDVTVTVKTGMRTSVAFSCINVLSQTIASLPYKVYRKNSEGVREEVNNSIAYLIHTRPNSYTSAFNFWYTVMAQTMGYGNAYVALKRNEKSIVSEMVLLDPNKVKPILAEGEIFYEVGNDVFIHQDDMLHIKMYSFDGIVGVSPIIWNKESFGYRIKQDEYKARVMDAKPPGILTFSSELTDNQIEANSKQWERMKKNVGTPVLSGGAKYQPMLLSPNEGQMIEASKLNQSEIAGIYRVPPSFIQNYENATFSNAEQQDMVYVKHSLTSWIRVIEQECDYKLFNSRSGLYTKFNIKGLLRGDIKTQSEFYRTMSNIGAMSPNDIRKIEDMPPIENGDQYFIQGAMIPLSKIESFYDKGEMTEDQRNKTMGFTVQQIKEGIDRLEIMNNS